SRRAANPRAPWPAAGSPAHATRQNPPRTDRRSRETADEKSCAEAGARLHDVKTGERLPPIRHPNALKPSAAGDGVVSIRMRTKHVRHRSGISRDHAATRGRNG